MFFLACSFWSVPLYSALVSAVAAYPAACTSRTGCSLIFKKRAFTSRLQLKGEGYLRLPGFALGSTRDNGQTAFRACESFGCGIRICSAGLRAPSAFGACRCPPPMLVVRVAVGTEPSACPPRVRRSAPDCTRSLQSAPTTFATPRPPPRRSLRLWWLTSTFPQSQMYDRHSRASSRSLPTPSTQA